MAGAYPAGRALQVSTDCRFQRRMLSGAWVKELTVIGVRVVQKYAASLDSCVSDSLCQLLCPRSRTLARLAVLPLKIWLGTGIWSFRKGGARFLL